MSSVQGGYDPTTFKHLTFYDAVPAFMSGRDDPLAYLDRCLAVIEAREGTVKAWTAMRVDGARVDAEASAARYRVGAPLSPIDGMPIGVKDLILTKDMPTGQGIAGNENARSDIDSACVQALRAAGAIVLGKLVTTEIGGAHPGPTTNPFDELRTPGGSSSGSGAAIGARMIPAAVGTQVGGSIMRPAGFCANFALKPTYGAINRGERQGYSQSCFGIHAGSVQDMWQVSAEIVKRVGGDPGHPGLFGPSEPPTASKPARLIVMETAGWTITDARTIAAFEAVLDQLRQRGVTILRRGDNPAIEEFERAIAQAGEIVSPLLAYENKWNLENLVRRFPTQLSPSPHAQLELARKLSLDDYRALLSRRSLAQDCLARLAPIGDALISLTAPGPATPINPGADSDARLRPLPTGNPVFNLPSSMLWAPAVSVPLIAVARMPVGVQVMGQMHDDYRVTAFSRWLVEELAPVIM